MGSIQLTDFPTEVLSHLCRFMSERDITSLSQTCHQLRHAFNNNMVWKKFNTKQVRNLKSQRPQLEPYCQPDESFCKNRQDVMRKNKVLSNWKAKRFVRYEFPLVVHDATFDSALFFKETFLIVFLMWAIQVWDVSGCRPLLYCSMNTARYIGYKFVIDDFLVIVSLLKVEVFRLNIEDKSIPVHYSFIIPEDKVAYGCLNGAALESGNSAAIHNIWKCFEAAERYLVCFEPQFYPTGDSNHCSIFHVWDIVNAHKVGVFESPLKGYSTDFHAFYANNFILYTRLPVSREVYFMFNVMTKEFSETGTSFQVELSKHTIVFFHEHHLIRYVQDRDDARYLNCEVYDFLSSCKIVERMFDAHIQSQGSSVVGGKLIIYCYNSFQVLDPLSLTTLSIIPHEQVNITQVVRQLSVFDSIHTVVLESNGEVRLWDLENQTPTLLMHTSLTQFELVLGRDPLSKLIILDSDRTVAVHFW